MSGRARISVSLLLVFTSLFTRGFAFAASQKVDEVGPSTVPFDVVSVRLSEPSGARYSWNNTPNSFDASGVRVKNLIARASGFPESRIGGAEGWPSTDMYTIAAKSDPDAGREMDDREQASVRGNEGKSDKAKSPASETSEGWDAHPHDLEERIFRDRLNMILVGRFKMRTHLETKVRSYSVLVANPRRFSLPVASEDSCKTPYMTLSGKSHCVTMNAVSELLTLVVGDLVVNDTNLDGKYDFSLPRVEGDDRSTRTDNMLSGLHSLGLDVKKEHGPIQILVVDHLERPTAN